MYKTGGSTLGQRNKNARQDQRRNKRKESRNVQLESRRGGFEEGAVGLATMYLNFFYAFGGKNSLICQVANYVITLDQGDIVLYCFSKQLPRVGLGTLKGWHNALNNGLCVASWTDPDFVVIEKDNWIELVTRPVAQ